MSVLVLVSGAGHDAASDVVGGCSDLGRVVLFQGCFCASDDPCSISMVSIRERLLAKMKHVTWQPRASQRRNTQATERHRTTDSFCPLQGQFSMSLERRFSQLIEEKNIPCRGEMTLRPLTPDLGLGSDIYRTIRIQHECTSLAAKPIAQGPHCRWLDLNDFSERLTPRHFWLTTQIIVPRFQSK